VVVVEVVVQPLQNGHHTGQWPSGFHFSRAISGPAVTTVCISPPVSSNTSRLTAWATSVCHAVWKSRQMRKTGRS
jgi:hypothetical protein